MAISTTEVTLSAGVYTLIASGPLNNVLVSGAPYSFKVNGSTSLPAANAPGIGDNWAGGSVSIGALASGDNLYGIPAASTSVVVTVLSY